MCKITMAVVQQCGCVIFIKLHFFLFLQRQSAHFLKFVFYSILYLEFLSLWKVILFTLGFLGENNSLADMSCNNTIYSLMKELEPPFSILWPLTYRTFVLS